MSEVNQNNPVSSFYCLNKMCELLGLGKTTIWELSRHDPDFPKPVKLTVRKNGTAGRVGWRADEVHTWINSRPRVDLRGGANNA